MRVLVACEESQAVCIEFRKRGHEAYSCDILPCSGGHPEWHIQDDVLKHLDDGWDMAIAFTPCTYSCNSGVRWLAKNGVIIDYERYSKMGYYAGMLRDILNSNINKVGCENPIPHKYAIDVIGRKYDQIIQPWQFGHGETKATCLWLKNLPPLLPNEIVTGREQRIWKMSPSENRSLLRSKTFPGIARAMGITSSAKDRRER